MALKKFSKQTIPPLKMQNSPDLGHFKMKNTKNTKKKLESFEENIQKMFEKLFKVLEKFFKVLKKIVKRFMRSFSKFWRSFSKFWRRYSKYLILSKLQDSQVSIPIPNILNIFSKILKNFSISSDYTVQPLRFKSLDAHPKSFEYFLQNF